MSPYQHGEVFVTKDGCETDLDLGHYERFIDVELTKSSNITSGQIYRDLIAQERRGDFLGGTIQSVPHVTNAIKESMFNLAEESQADVIVVEVGGTVGDIEGLPFLEAIRQMRRHVGRASVFHVHVTLLPYIGATGELKTKPTQHSVKELRSIGIQPDVIICRADRPIRDEIKVKVSLFCDVHPSAVIALPTVDNIYQVPLILEDEGLGQLITEALDLSDQHRDLSEWRNMVDQNMVPMERLPIAVVGKYTELHDAYISVTEALRHAGYQYNREIDVEWINSEDLEHLDPHDLLRQVSGILVPGGFGSRGIEGMIRTVEYARVNHIPYLGLCLGMQVMVIEHARHLLGLQDANSTEFDPATPHPVVDIMPDQLGVSQLGGTMRLGNYPCQILPGTKVGMAYSADFVVERHRHRFEFNNAYREPLREIGLLASGLSPGGHLVEIMEQIDHPFMLGVQFHPEFRSRPQQPHPLFAAFVGAASGILREGAQHFLPTMEIG
jgi:CTP synthase